MAKLTDGFSSTISFASDSSVSVWEVEVTPPSIQGGGGHRTSTMRNTTYHTNSPGSLIDIGDCTVLVAYDPATWSEMIAMCNVEQLITVTWPDGSSLAFYGWVDVFEPTSLVENEMPTANMTIKASNNNSGTETGPAYSAA